MSAESRADTKSVLLGRILLATGSFLIAIGLVARDFYFGVYEVRTPWPLPISYLLSHPYFTAVVGAGIAALYDKFWMGAVLGYALPAGLFAVLTTLGWDRAVLTSPQELDSHVGQIVTIRGEFKNSKPQTILGVEVSSTHDLHGQVAEAVGLLDRYTITQQLPWLPTRGVGSHFTLLTVTNTAHVAEARPVSP